jgi:hypothetical protein
MRSVESEPLRNAGTSVADVVRDQEVPGSNTGAPTRFRRFLTSPNSRCTLFVPWLLTIGCFPGEHQLLSRRSLVGVVARKAYCQRDAGKVRESGPLCSWLGVSLETRHPMNMGLTLVKSGARLCPISVGAQWLTLPAAAALDPDPPL